jgi:predicted Na+-dependent transporter
MFAARLFKNRNFIFILAFVLGFAIGDNFPWLKHLVVPALALVMTVSMSEISNRSFLPIKSAIRPALFILGLNYILFSLIIIVPAYFFIEDLELWKGFVIIAASPAGVAIAPFTGILGGDKAFSLKGVIISHILALIAIPVYSYWFIGVSFIQPIKLLILFAELIIAPFLISRLIIKLKAYKYVLRFRGPLVNWGLFFVILIVIALNRSYIFAYPRAAGIVSAIAFIAVFGTGLILELIIKRSKAPGKIKSSLVLFATVKNGGFAAAAALSLAGERASLPAALISVVIIIYLIYLSFRASSFS